MFSLAGLASASIPFPQIPGPGFDALNRPKLRANRPGASGPAERKRLNPSRPCWLLPWLALGLAGCKGIAPPAMPDPLRVGVLPDQTRERLEAIYTPLVRYLGETLHVRAELTIPASYEDLGERFHRRELDLAFFGGATFIAAERRDGAAPLVARTIDLHFTSIVIARQGIDGSFPDDFRGRSFVFGPRASTSGHLMPRHFFAELPLTPEAFFKSVAYLENHDAVIAAVLEGRADMGVVNGPVLRRRMAEGAVDPERFRQVWESPPYPDYVWAVQAALPTEISLRLQEAFLGLDAANPEQARILDALGTAAYLPATRASFAPIRQALPAQPAHAPSP